MLTNYGATINLSTMKEMEMGPDSLIQIIALLAAVYALIPRAKRLELRIRFGSFSIMIGLLYIVITIFLLYYSVFQKTTQFLPEWTCEEVFSPKDIIFFVTVFLTVILGMYYKISKPSVGDIHRFQELMEEFLYSKNFSELISIIERHWNYFIQLENNSFPATKLRKTLTLSLDECENKNKLKKNLCKTNLFVRKKSNKIVDLILKDYSPKSETAKELLRIVLLNEGFVKALAMTRPSLAYKTILPSNVSIRRKFFDIYIRELLKNKQSIFYREVKESVPTYSTSELQSLEKNNKLLQYLFDHIKTAKECNNYPFGRPLLISKEKANGRENMFARNDAILTADDLQVTVPILKQVSQILDKNYISPEQDSYNYPVITSVAENEWIWSDPIYISISFFDILIYRALHEGFPHKMDLDYLVLFTEKIVRNYRPIRNSDNITKYSIRYFHLLKQIIEVLESWIRETKFVPQNQENIAIKKTNTWPENTSILKSSILVMSQCLEIILASKNIQLEQKEPLMKIAFILFVDLRGEPSTEKGAYVLREALTPEKNRDNVMIYLNKFRSSEIKQSGSKYLDEF